MNRRALSRLPERLDMHSKPILGAAVAAALLDPCNAADVARSFGALPNAFIRAEMASRTELQDRLIRIQQQVQGIVAAADDAGRSLTDEENSRMAELDAAFGATSAQLARLERDDGGPSRHAVRGDSQSAGRKLPMEMRVHDMGAGDRPPNARNEPDLSRGTPRLGMFINGLRSPSAALFGPQRSEWKNDTEFFRAAIAGTSDPRLFRNATGVESVGVDGGFSVPPGFYGGVIDAALQEAVFAPRCRVFSSPGNSLVIPMPDTLDRSGGTIAGLAANWSAENEQQPRQKMKWIAEEVKLNKTFILTEASSELVEDGVNYVEQLKRAMAESTAYLLDSAILYGNGVGKPIGLINSPGVVVASKKSGQTADTVVFENLVAMYSRLTPRAQKNGTWFISTDLMPQLLSMVFPGSTNPVLINLFTGGAANPIGMTIFGRPVVTTEIAPRLGDKGDIIFADMNEYALLLKNGARIESSIHVGFDRDVVDWRLILRVGGQPLYPSPITPWNGGPTMSWAAVLEDRT